MTQIVPLSIMDMLTDAAGSDWAIQCPRCRQFNSHIAQVYTRRDAGADEAPAAYSGTTMVTRAQRGARRAALVVEFDGECEHRWALVIQQDRGTDYVLVEDAGPSRLYEDMDSLLDAAPPLVIGD